MLVLNRGRWAYFWTAVNGKIIFCWMLHCFFSISKLSQTHFDGQWHYKGAFPTCGCLKINLCFGCSYHITKFRSLISHHELWTWRFSARCVRWHTQLCTVHSTFAFRCTVEWQGNRYDEFNKIHKHRQIIFISAYFTQFKAYKIGNVCRQQNFRSIYNNLASNDDSPLVANATTGI